MTLQNKLDGLDSPSRFISDSKHLRRRQARHWLRCVLSTGQRPTTNYFYTICTTVCIMYSIRKYFASFSASGGAKWYYTVFRSKITCYELHLWSLLLPCTCIYDSYGCCVWRTQNNLKTHIFYITEFLVVWIEVLSTDRHSCRFRSVFPKICHRKLCKECPADGLLKRVYRREYH